MSGRWKEKWDGGAENRDRFTLRHGRDDDRHQTPASSRCPRKPILYIQQRR